MRVLVVGGTRFIGRHVVAQLRDDGHELTLLNRGKTHPEVFAELPRITVDRSSPELARAPGLSQDWDAVVDLSAYFPAEVEALLAALRGRIGHYVFCSTISVFSDTSADGPVPWLDEQSPLRLCSRDEAVNTEMATYGARKAECERVAWRLSSAPVTILRPSVVFGRHDHTDRMAYWIWRAASRKRFVLPDDGLAITRRTYAPDLARAFSAALARPQARGQTYNIAESRALSLRQTLIALGRHLGAESGDPLERAQSIPSERLERAGVKPWADLPLWLPRSHLLLDTFKMRLELAIEETPPERALAEAADAFLALGAPPVAGLSEEAEARLLASLGC